MTSDAQPTTGGPWPEETWFSDDAPYLRALLDVLPSMVWAATVGHGMDYFSQRWVEFTGASEQQLRARGYFEFVHPDDVAMLRTQSDGATPGNEQVLRFRMRRHDGNWRWMEAHHRVIETDGGVLRAVGATTDITEQVEAEDEVQRRSDLLEQTMGLARIGGFVWQFSPEGEGLSAEPLGALLEIMGVGRERIAEEGGIEKVFDVIHPDDHGLVQAEMARSLDPDIGEYRIDHRILIPRGEDAPEERWISVLARMQFDEQRRPYEMLGVMQDVTERRRAEQARLQLQKSEAVATLAGGVAHDFGNVVGAIRNAARAAQAEQAAGESVAATMEEIAAAAARAAELVERLVAFAKPQEPRVEAVDPVAVINEVIDLVRPALPASIELTFVHDSAPPELCCDPGQLHQVVVNLITNASQAIGAEPGRIAIELDRCETTGGEAARIAVTDDGCGMDPDAVRRAFDPFFTTRAANGGSGLGLAAVHTIVSSHRGTVQAESGPDGTTLTVLLPLRADGRVGATPGD